MMNFWIGEGEEGGEEKTFDFLHLPWLSIRTAISSFAALIANYKSMETEYRIILHLLVFLFLVFRDRKKYILNRL